MNLRNFLISTTRLNKKLIALSSDIFSILISTLIALVVSQNTSLYFSLDIIIRLLWLPILCALVFWKLGVYRSVLRFIDISLVFILAKALIVVALLNVLSILFYKGISSLLFNEKFNSLISNEGWLVGFIVFSICVFGSRFFAYYYLSDRNPEKKVAIYGAGSAGIQLASALRVSKEMQPVVFLDKNPALHGTYVGGVKVLNPSKLERLSSKGKVDEVLIAMPSASKATLRNLLKEIENFSLKVRILPGLAELAQGKILVSELKEVDVSDLLGRYEVEANQTLINRNIFDKVVLITGAGGSIGSEISRQVAKNNPRKVILVDANEYALYSVKKEIEKFDIDIEIYSILANVVNKRRITEVCKTFDVDTIYHAAAYKHVPLVEENPFEGVINNIEGTKICAEAAIEARVETFVLISTDKAVRPTNIMGATKRFAELILQSLAPKNQTRMIMVRFGNVIGSSGSAIPLFQQQIKEGGPVTVTHPEVTRYFMSIPEAAELVIQAGAMGNGGDLFVLDMGEPVKIYELAKRLINLSGMEVKDKDNPDGDIEIIFTGLRPGEKLYEELLIGDSVDITEHKQILKAKEDFLDPEELNIFLDALKEAEKTGDVLALRDIFKEVVSGFVPEDEVVDIVYKNKT